MILFIQLFKIINKKSQNFFIKKLFTSEFSFIAFVTTK